VTSGVETTAAEMFLITRLKAANVASGRVYSGVAPPGAVEPYVIVQEQSPGTAVLYAIGVEQIWIDPLFIVKAVKATGSWTELTPVVKAAHAALQNTTGAMTDGTILSCLREKPFKLIEVPQTTGQQYRHLGNAYRVLVT
jgi:hypothetical protein